MSLEPCEGNLVQNFSLGSKSLILRSLNIEACFPTEYLKIRKKRENELKGKKALKRQTTFDFRNPTNSYYLMPNWRLSIKS